MTEPGEKIARLIAAAVAPPVAGTLVVYLGAVILQQYGWVMFLALPVLMGFTSTFIYSDGSQSYWKCFLVGLLSIGVIGLLIMVFAIEGLVCLAMTLPLAVPLIALGVAIAWSWRGKGIVTRRGIGLSTLLFLLMPLAMGFEVSNRSTPTVHQVVSTVEIDAPIEIVWKNVVEFPQIDAKPEGVLALGFAYPINAKIDGTGVGAVRYCNFDTGPFVEPITAWQEPNLLAFDVKEQPPAMTELSPYKHLHSAHLQYIRSQRGQFRLYEKDGKTIVEGTTVYTHDIAPDIYWQLFSDEIIHQIHMRVLNHIKLVSEKES